MAGLGRFTWQPYVQNLAHLSDRLPKTVYTSLHDPSPIRVQLVRIGEKRNKLWVLFSSDIQKMMYEMK